MGKGCMYEAYVYPTSAKGWPRGRRDQEGLDIEKSLPLWMVLVQIGISLGIGARYHSIMCIANVEREIGLRLGRRQGSRKLIEAIE